MDRRTRLSAVSSDPANCDSQQNSPPILIAKLCAVHRPQHLRESSHFKLQQSAESPLVNYDRDIRQAKSIAVHPNSPRSSHTTKSGQLQSVPTLHKMHRRSTPNHSAIAPPLSPPLSPPHSLETPICRNVTPQQPLEPTL